MYKSLCNSREYLVGHHPKIGLLIYDPKDQDEIELDEVKVKLFKVSRGQSATFVKETIREKLVPCDEKYLPSIEKAVNEYIKNMNDQISEKERPIVTNANAILIVNMIQNVKDVVG